MRILKFKFKTPTVTIKDTLLTIKPTLIVEIDDAAGGTLNITYSISSPDGPVNVKLVATTFTEDLVQVKTSFFNEIEFKKKTTGIKRDFKLIATATLEGSQDEREAILTVNYN